MKVKFQADADFSHRIVRAIRRREPAIDFQTANLAKLRGLSDQDVLALAAKESRILVSHDLKTMPDCFAQYTKSQASSGLLILRQKLTILQAIEELMNIWITSESSDWINQMRIL